MWIIYIQGYSFEQQKKKKRKPKCPTVQMSLSICRGLIPGLHRVQKNTDAQVPYVKMEHYLHITYAHSAIWFKSAGILEWVAISFSKGSSQPRDQTNVFCTGSWILYRQCHLQSPQTLYMQLLLLLKYIWEVCGPVNLHKKLAHDVCIAVITGKLILA